MNNQQASRRRLTSGLLQAGRQWRRLAEAALAADDISEACASPLVWLRRLGGGVRQVTLAAHVGIEGTSLVRLLDQLCDAGFVVRRDDPEDRRAKTLWLTAEGEQLAERIERAIARLRSRIFAEISEADVEATLRVLEALEHAHTRLQQNPSLLEADS
ncbi:MAG: MarR family transcriptional regulator [Rhizobiales bacterium 17-65-6]|jgi:MarR family transcriptional regulator for hemolysin|uniref:Transcriptional regulator, MarR family n=1 Tax=Xanthobacter autotrophicus (strain ATCC BAA-1158 / Py2) TaxID=78245 RepID=A7IQ40_XANP2|nr:transcriptional regulator, MarR family [Xanthobacter autotrophicus Py2]OYX90671.1 MAG: MarR family transcriptional regulator [Azorhizobium sp. 32-67-21]OYZ99463.1 MAG: MarR family transcriptional regulator [Rhizobiales bacterium 17-65-6]